MLRTVSDETRQTLIRALEAYFGGSLPKDVHIPDWENPIRIGHTKMTNDDGKRCDIWLYHMILVITDDEDSDDEPEYRSYLLEWFDDGRIRVGLLKPKYPMTIINHEEEA